VVGRGNWHNRHSLIDLILHPSSLQGLKLQEFLTLASARDMAPSDLPIGKSRVVPGRNPPPGTDPYADAIRERRGARGLTPLDENLLHVPPIAGGYSSLLGAVRTGGKLPGDIREAMVCNASSMWFLPLYLKHTRFYA
jgi:hypothetical protein